MRSAKQGGHRYARIVAFSYGTLCYLAFLATLLYAVAFLGNIGLSRTIDGEATVPFWLALLINTLLLDLLRRNIA
jgi:methanethiol S-methyltransferase